MPVVGTAGHVDHGKSTLVQALTGRDPDRWAEEKRRGLTIDIGFAWTSLEGREVSFVDVPGHERYLKNMLAGIEAIDAALVVVAADEGWMPQSEEHLAVLDLLEINRGVVALTKTDMVETDLADLAALEIEERLQNTALEGAPIVPVSALTGSGLDELRHELAICLPPDPEESNRPRLWIDRSFSIEGAGTVVTGTLLAGTLPAGASVAVYPNGATARVRSLQSHEAELAEARPTRRLAVNLGGIDRGQVTRGHMLGIPGQWEVTNRFSATIGQARYIGDIKARGDYQLHIGSGAYRVDLQRHENGVAVLALTASLPLMTGDRFILRDTGRRLVVAGGRVLDPSPGTLSRAIDEGRSIDPAASPNSIATRLLEIRGTDTLARLAAHSGGGFPTGAFFIEDIAVSPSRVAEIRERVKSLVDADHAEHPLRPGLPMATLATKLGVRPAIVEEIVHETPDLERSGPDVRRRGHDPGLDPVREKAWLTARQLLAASLAVPPISDLGLDAESLHLLVRDGLLCRISPEFVVLVEQTEEIRSIISGMGSGFTVAEFRDAAALTRKHAVPFLEWADNEGLTIRRGDLRIVR